MARCIVCGIDEATGARHVASFAARLAGELDLRLLLVHVIAADGLFARLRLPTVIRMRRTLKAMVGEDRFPQRTGIRVKTGDPASALKAIAEGENAELIVVGAGGEALASARLLGGVATTLMRRSSCPVVVVPLAAAAPSEGEVMRSVVCGVAGEESDAALLRLAHDLAERLRAELHAVHAYDLPRARGSTPDPVRDAAMRELAERRLAVALKDAGVRALGTILPLPAAEALERVAEQQRPALVAVGAKGRREEGSMFLGPIPTELAACGRTPVAVLPLAASVQPGIGKASQPRATRRLDTTPPIPPSSSVMSSSSCLDSRTVGWIATRRNEQPWRSPPAIRRSAPPF
jgi:nucleotide-binding universal stress UspA family protein